MARSNWNDEDERPTSRGGKCPPSDIDHTVGSLMVESLNHRKRIEMLEEVVERAGLTPGSLPPSGKHSIFVLIRKTVTTTTLIIAAVLAALRELGFLNVH
jgi:hypothetical protein